MVTVAILAKNATMKSSLPIQPRQLRKWHEDAHYCAALFRYLKEFSIRFKDNVDLVFMDDKHRCKVGEPGMPVAAIDRLLSP